VRVVTSVYQVYEISGSPFQLGLTGFFQALPFVLFGLFAGAVADAFDRKKLLLLTTLIQLFPGLILSVLTLTGTIQVWHVYLLAFMGAFVEVFNWPARSALIPRLVPHSVLMNAVTISTMIIQMSFLLGPAIGGVLIDYTSIAMTYFLSTLLLVPALGTVKAVRTSGKPEGKRRRVNLRSILEGLEFIWIQRIILSLFLLDFGVTLVGFYRPILPILSADVFQTGASGLGILYAAPSFGSVLGSIGLLMAVDIKRKGIAVVLAAVFFAASLGLLGLSQWFWMAVVVVILLGITDAVSVAIRRTVVQLLAPDQMRGRIMAAYAFIVVGLSQTIGAFGAGAVARVIGVHWAIGGGAVAMLLYAIWAFRRFPELMAA
jgi:MFS family permease